MTTGNKRTLPGAGVAVAAAIGVYSTLATVTAPLAADLAALVEDVSGVAGLSAFDYVPAGRTIDLGATGALTLTYLESCVHERITGGTVVVGTEASEVRGGQVRRGELKCDKGALRLSGAQAGQSAAFAMRSLPGAGPKPELTIHGRSPVFEVAASGRLTIERVDRQAAAVTLDLAPRNALRPGLYDAVRARVALAPGGTYRARVGDQSIVFEVAADAAEGAAPLLGRLIRF